MTIYRKSGRSSEGRSFVERDAIASLPKGTKCIWPECNGDAWLELDLRICPHHAAKVHNRVSEAIPKPRIRPSRARPKEVGQVYFARVGEFVKIGYSANVPKRMKEVKGEYLVSMDGTPADERAMHKRFSEYHENDEFYRPGPKLVAYILAKQRETP